MFKTLRALVALASISLAMTAHAQAPAIQNPPYRIHQLALGGDVKTATATAGAATLAKSSGVITTEVVTTAAGATYTLTLTNSLVGAADQVFASVQNGTNNAGLAQIATVTPGAGNVVIVVRNAHASAAFNGTLKIAFALLKN